jgi:hypothetical protein
MLTQNRAGNYHFLASAGRPYSGGAVADEGYDIVHARFERPIQLDAGLAAAAEHVSNAGRPIHSIAGFELRSPKPFSREDFETFNVGYVTRLTALGLEVDGLMPAARTNVSPTVGAVTEVSVYAFSYTIAGSRRRRAFVASGSAEEKGTDTASRLGSIMGILSGRLEELGASWDDATAIQLYGIDDIQAQLVERVLRYADGAAVHGIQWFPSLPPVEGLKLEIDVRSAGTELVLPGA